MTSFEVISQPFDGVVGFVELCVDPLKVAIGFVELLGLAVIVPASVVEVDLQSDILISQGMEFSSKVFRFSCGGAEVLFFRLLGVEQRGVAHREGFHIMLYPCWALGALVSAMGGYPQLFDESPGWGFVGGRRMRRGGCHTVVVGQSNVVGYKWQKFVLRHEVGVRECPVGHLLIFLRVPPTYDWWC